MLFLIKIWEYLPAWFRHITEGSLWFGFGWLAGKHEAVMLCLAMAFVTEFRDEVEAITKPNCHPEGFSFKDFGFRAFPVWIVFVWWLQFTNGS